MIRLSCSAAILVLTACATNEKSETPDDDGTGALGSASVAVSQTRDGLEDAALSPLEDVNLRREPIPDQLKDLETPYFQAVDMTCDEIASAVSALSQDLGSDWDVQTEEGDESLSRWAADRSASAILNAVSSQARGFIPFRGLVREATGAASHAAKVRKAYQIGTQRRAFLKGVGQAMGCAPPAAPAPVIEAEEMVPGTGETEEGETPVDNPETEAPKMDAGQGTVSANETLPQDE